MKVLVISANAGGICTNKVVKDTNVDFICIDKTNFPKRHLAMHPRLLGKIPKMLAWELYPSYDVYIWIDGSFSINKKESIKWFIDQLGDKKVAFFVHPYRHSVREEIEYCSYLMRDGDKYLLDRYSGEDME